MVAGESRRCPAKNGLEVFGVAVDQHLLVLDPKLVSLAGRNPFVGVPAHNLVAVPLGIFFDFPALLLRGQTALVVGHADIADRRDKLVVVGCLDLRRGSGLHDWFPLSLP